jgi:hypothetical protein
LDGVLDATILPVKVRETVFGDAISVHLALAPDVYSHSLVAFPETSEVAAFEELVGCLGGLVGAASAHHQFVAWLERWDSGGS